ncbi:ABC-three component system middle component 6 [Saccharothrix longispora]|uniref:ABC-three component system middle component 6 n=1 Tax=Saccharothrix longispora TaxID=33920 RepID=UPI0028FD4B50|nr:ABC-three component system middle component 6 [Saccharothrix longispora]MDU0294606.1 ABC-three component system middle component 6 [Saccharothrix longispora]
MITPTKGVRPERSLLYIGGQILSDLDRPTTVSGAWEALARRRRQHGQEATVTFDWFVLALDLLRALGTIRLQDGLIVKVGKS